LPPLKLWSYWTKVRQILTPRSQIIATEPFAIRIAIFHSFWNAKATNESELADFADFDPKIGCHGNVS